MPPPANFSNRGEGQRLADLEEEVQELRRLIDPAYVTTATLRQATAMSRGGYAGYGNPQNDTYAMDDNVDSTHGLRLDYVIPSNYQRLIRAKLTIVLRAFRSYDTGIASATTAAGPHVHYWTTSGAGVLNWTLGMDNAGVPKIGGAALPPPYGYQTSSEHAAAVGAAVFTTTEAYDGTGHTHSVTPSLTYGVFEGVTANNVSIFFDGDNQNAAFTGAPFTATQVELDITSVLTTLGKTYLSQKVLHTITLTPTTLGRIHGILRLTMFCDGSVTS